MIKSKRLGLLIVLAVFAFVANHYQVSVENKCLNLGNSANQCAKLNR